MKDHAKQEEWDAIATDEAKEANPRMAEPYREALKKAEQHAMELEAGLAHCRAENDRLKAEARSQPVVNIYIGGKGIGHE